jgi:hypothetical protein
MKKAEERLTLDDIDEGDGGLGHIRLADMLLVIASRSLVAALGTVLLSHAGLGHDEDIGHVLTGCVGGLVDDLLHFDVVVVVEKVCE